MAIDATLAFNQQVQALAKSGDKAGSAPTGREVSELAHAKNLAQKGLNASILESTIESSIANSPQVLVLKTALDGINDVLQASLGENAIQNAYDAGLDVSPDATATRIVSLSTNFFSQYQEQHSELGQEEAVATFVDIIRGGIETGFSEARDILSSLSVLEGDIASNVDETYGLVQEKLAEFVTSFSPG
ncbi:MAG: DUF5610 domain-containing protein [Cycloclasticus sp.]|nr:DUF5610 domain-containing protein [Cycloclasticus sp.]